MHARIDELLSLLDGEPVAAEVADHAAQCAHCKTESMRLAARRLHLKGLPMIEPGAEHWSQIQARVASPRSGYSRRWVAAAALAAVVLMLALAWRESAIPETPSVAGRVMQSPRDAASLAELLRRSRELDDLLSQLPARPQVERTATAVTIEVLQTRIQWLDDRLSFVAEARLADVQAQRLWHERVQLMDSLVKVRYAESGAEYLPSDTSGEML